MPAESTARTTGSDGFPDGFMWGTGASSLQTEGAAPRSDWCAWEAAGRAPRSGDGNGFGARYQEDFAQLADEQQLQAKALPPVTTEDPKTSILSAPVAAPQGLAQFAADAEQNAAQEQAAPAALRAKGIENEAPAMTYTGPGEDGSAEVRREGGRHAAGPGTRRERREAARKQKKR